MTLFNTGRGLGVFFSLVSIIVNSSLLLTQPYADRLIPLFYGGLPPLFTLLGFLLWRPQRSLVRTWPSAIRATAVAGFTVALWVFTLAGVNPLIRYATTAVFVVLLLALIVSLVRARNRQTDGRLAYLMLTIVIMSSVYVALLLWAFRDTPFRLFAMPAFMPLSLFLYLAYRDRTRPSDPEAMFLIAAGAGNMSVFTTMGAFSVGIFYLPLVLALLISAITAEVAVADGVFSQIQDYGHF